MFAYIMYMHHVYAWDLLSGDAGRNQIPVTTMWVLGTESIRSADTPCLELVTNMNPHMGAGNTKAAGVLNC